MKPEKKNVHTISWKIAGRYANVVHTNSLKQHLVVD